MTDPISGLAATQGVKSFGAVVDKLLGPTAEIMGQEMAGWYARKKNVQKVAERAAVRAGTETDGAIPPRLAAEVFEKAQWADEEFVAEYLSGVLASGRSPDGKNDAAISWTALVGRLSSDQLALHWLIYTGLQSKISSSPPDRFWDVIKEQLLLDYRLILAALGWPLGELSSQIRLLEAAYGLEREGLIAKLSHGDSAYLANEVAWTKGSTLREGTSYLTLTATSYGTGLLLYALGRGKAWFADIVSEATSNAIAQPGTPSPGPQPTFVSDARAK